MNAITIHFLGAKLPALMIPWTTHTGTHTLPDMYMMKPPTARF